MHTATPMGGMTFTFVAAQAQMELNIMRERITDSLCRRRTAGTGIRAGAGHSSQERRRLIDGGQPGTPVAKGPRPASHPEQ